MYAEPLKASVHAGFRRKSGQPVRLTLGPGKTTRGFDGKGCLQCCLYTGKTRENRAVTRQLKTDLRADHAHQHAFHRHQRRELRLDVGRPNDLGSTVGHYEKQHVMKIVPHEMGILCTYA